MARFDETAVVNGKKAGAAYLDTYENTVLSLADSYEKAAGATRNRWVADIVHIQARYARELTKAYVNAARELVS